MHLYCVRDKRVSIGKICAVLKLILTRIFNEFIYVLFALEFVATETFVWEVDKTGVKCFGEILLPGCAYNAKQNCNLCFKILKAVLGTV